MEHIKETIGDIMKITKELYDELSELSSAMLNEKGQEINNPKPLFIRGENQPLSLQQRVQRLLRSELSKQAAEQEMETFEESQDFDIEDEFLEDEPLTRYSILEDEIPIMAEEKIEPREKVEPEAVTPAPEEKTETETEIAT